MRQRSFVFLQHELITLSCQGLMNQQELAPIYRNGLYIVLHLLPEIVRVWVGVEGMSPRGFQGQSP